MQCTLYIYYRVGEKYSDHLKILKVQLYVLEYIFILLQGEKKVQCTLESVEGQLYVHLVHLFLLQGEEKVQCTVYT